MQRTALHYAIQEEFMDVVQYLVEVVGVDIHQTDEVTQRTQFDTMKFYFAIIRIIDGTGWSLCC